MGTGALQLSQSQFLPGLSSLLTGQSQGLLSRLLGTTPQSIVAPAASAAEEPDDSNVVSGDESQAIQNQFDALVYRSQVERFSLTLALQEAAARATDEDGAASAEAQASQLSFSFFSESRTEELVRFSQRTQAVADGLEGSQQTSYLEASRRVSQRFSVSLNISGAALNGFAGASEKLSGPGDADGIDQLLGLSEEALDSADDILHQIFELLGDFFTNTETDFQTRFNELLEGLQSIGLIASPTGSAGTGSTQQVQTQAFSYNLQLEFSFESTEVVQITQGQVQQSDPITFDLDGDGVELTNYAAGARFDILGNGQQANTAFVTGGDAFLALDRNGNGTIDSGKELFGDQRGAQNGFEELRKLDGNGDGVIDARDEAFTRLRLFKDNGNGVTEAGELLSLADAGIASISLAYRDVDEAASGGNRTAQSSSFRYEDGRRGRVVDTILNFTV
ncbi:MAG: hypothetical protein IT364_03670 [Candidatus Hydrogenedentes bacterium]|nr:hypothetical protein [Candidatus Hydrogenedentota bacterium]